MDPDTAILLWGYSETLSKTPDLTRFRRGFDRLSQESALLEKGEGKKKRRLSSSHFVAEKARKSNGGVLRYPFPEFQNLLGKKAFGEGQDFSKLLRIIGTEVFRVDSVVFVQQSHSDKEAKMNRRRFMKNTSGSLALLGFPATLASLERIKDPERLERRSLGKTGEKLSILGFGGIVVMDATAQEASTRVGEAIEGGVNYFDVAPSYGNAEDRLGPALQPYRNNVFLACKTTERDKAGAARELESSLKKMRTDYFDLYQLHAMTKLEDVDKVFSASGAMGTFLEARKSGKVRFLGFSAHSVEAALALMDRFNFDTILFPVNFATWHAGNFGPQVLAKAQEKKMGILALKAMARGPWAKDVPKAFSKCWYEPLSNPSDAMKGLRFTLSHPVTAAIPPGDETLFKMALGLAKQFTPLPFEEAEAIKRWALKGNPIFKYPMEKAG